MVGVDKARCVPGRWWELRGPVAVWTPGGIWATYEAEHYRTSEFVELELGARVAHVLAARQDLFVPFGDGAISRPRELPPRTGQLNIFDSEPVMLDVNPRDAL